MKKKLSAQLLDQRVNYASFEESWYKRWNDSGAFLPLSDRLEQEGRTKEADIAKKEHFSIVIPPPNVTGKLHIGHGLNTILQDILIRYHRMLGKNVVWIPGTDHAGIATQNVVEKIIEQEGNSRETLGREMFVTRVAAHAEEHRNIIREQLEKLGASCDWTRDNFTFSDRLSQVVRDVFVRLWEKGLIYKGHYLVNWSTKSQTALSDDEVEYKSVTGKLYYVQYPLVDSDAVLTVATTRPETIFGDTAVAVNPEDERYAAYVGSLVRLPLTDKKIPIIADAHVDTSFGTGALKITPAHAINDYEIGKRHNLDVVNILNTDGTLNDTVPEEFRGISVQEARGLAAQKLEEEGFLEKTEPHTHQVGYCYRTGVPIEPYLSEQWFVKMKPLAEQALQTWEEQGLTFFPERWKNTYLHWMNNIRDWCISRQLWWGHRIPVWYNSETGESIVSRDDPHTIPEHAGKKFHQDEDVLDTWFSSWLWPFSVFGWPEKNSDVENFYPTSTLVTGYDIIFFWVARMVMAGLEFTQQNPFRDVYITPLVRDKKGRKMSKSLGNGIDPLEIIEMYGSDALRFTLSYQLSQGTDLLVDAESFSFGSRFITKLWNASRFIFRMMDDVVPCRWEDIALDSTDKWMINCIEAVTNQVHTAMAEYQFNGAAHVLYDCVWGDYCDWYVELAKRHLYSEDIEIRSRMVNLLLHIHKRILTLLHPFLPFVSEEIHSMIPEAIRHETELIVTEYPIFCEDLMYNEEGMRFATMQTIVRAIRSTRSEFSISPKKQFRCVIEVLVDDPVYSIIVAFQEEICFLCNIDAIELCQTFDYSFTPMTRILDNVRIHLDIRSMVDDEKELQRLHKQIDKITKVLKQCEQKLNNKQFLEHADPSVVQQQQELYELSHTHMKQTKEIVEMVKGAPE